LQQQNLKEQIEGMPQVRAGSYIKWFSEIGIKDVPLIAGKLPRKAKWQKIATSTSAARRQAIAQNLTSL
jgi:hypothetical protein